MIRWDDYYECVRWASEYLDADAARDVALAVLEDVAAKQLSLTAQQLKWRVRWRAKDVLRRAKLPMTTCDIDIDRLPGASPTPEQEYAAKQMREQLVDELGQPVVEFLERCGEQSFEDIARSTGLTESTLRKARTRARRQAKEVLE